MDKENEQKRIAVVTPTFLPYRGGMCVVAEQDAAALASLGHRVDVFVPGDGQPRGNGEYSVVGLRPWFRYGHAVLVPSAASACRGYDLTVLHYPFYGGAEPVAWARRRGRCGKLVVYYHMDTLGRGVVKAVSRVHGLLMRDWIVGSADRIAVSSFDYTRSSALESRFTDDPSLFREMPPAVDVERFSPGEAPVKLLDRYGLVAGRPTVLFVGGLDRAHYFKGIEVLVRAMATAPLKGAQALIVGEGELRPGYERLAESLGVSDRVRFSGAVSDEELPLHYRLADVFAFPSLDRSEAFGIAPLEAMASGVPVVASDLPGVRTIVRSGETGFHCLPGSVSSLSARLADVLADDRVRQELSYQGRKMAVEEYSSDRRVRRWARLLGELVA